MVGAEPLNRIHLHQRDRVFEILPGSRDVEVWEGPCVFRFTATSPVTVTFDDAPITVHWSERRDAGFGQLDLTNQVGFHRFVFQANSQRHVFDFRTSTAKATWHELRAMALVVVREAFAFKRQFLYTTREGKRKPVPIPELDVAWIRDRLPELCALVEAIDRRPATETRPVFHSSHEARGVSIPHTSRFLREHPRLLESRADGPISVLGTEYWPATVVVRNKNREPARIEHMQLSHFLSLLARRLVELQKLVPPDLRDAVAKWQQELGRARSRRVLSKYAHGNNHLAWTPLRTALQRVDARYKRLRDLHAEFLHDVQASEENVDTARANVKDAWEIYQSFAAHMIGRALGLRYVSETGDLRQRAARGFSMHSDEVELYYDARPTDLLPSWRDQSSRPGQERPDIVLFNRTRGLVAMLDAKFRIDPDGVSARNEDLFEMQGYMNSSGLASGAIVFPGRSTPRAITGDGTLLLELPLRADSFASGKDDALQMLADSIGQLWGRPWNPLRSVSKVDSA